MDIECTVNNDVPEAEAPSSEQHLLQLNEAQKQAVLNTQGPLLVLAGAGTGKTKVLTTRIMHIMSQSLARPSQILAVTFTNKAAAEMKERINNIVDCSGIWLGTFHSLAARILRYHADHFGLTPNFTIVNNDDQTRLIKSIMESMHFNTSQTKPKLIAHIISAWKDRGVTPEKITNSDIKNEKQSIASSIYETYQKQLLNSNCVDFGDLTLYNNRLFMEKPEILSHYQNIFKYILVDEYQDTNAAQYLWIRMLASHHRNICCVGDDDQSIYSWRGAEVANILRFDKDFKDAKIIRLEQNYRSTTPILVAASSVIKRNRVRHGKQLWTDKEGGNKINIIECYNDKEEARYITKEIENKIKAGQFRPSQIAILIRASFQTRTFEECFNANTIAYKIVGGFKFYERMEIRDALAYLRVALNHNDNLALERIINTPKRAIGNSTLQAIKNYAQEYSIGIFTAIEEMIKKSLFKPKMHSTLQHMTELFSRWNTKINSEKPYDAAKNILEESGYINMWKQEKSEEGRTRVENLHELLRAIAEFDSIEEYIQHASLVMENDADASTEQVNIITLHGAKGLEFEAVYLPGWEEGIFPHQKTLQEEGEKGLEEERRIAYVGITRAKSELTISYAKTRRIYNEFINSAPSRFISEIPESIITSKSANDFSYSGASFAFCDPATTKFNNYNKKTPNNNVNNSAHDNSPWRPGGKVSHPKFGTGIIISKTDDNITIAFSGAGLKSIKQQFLTLN